MEKMRHEESLEEMRDRHHREQKARIREPGYRTALLHGIAFPIMEAVYIAQAISDLGEGDYLSASLTGLVYVGMLRIPISLRYYTAVVDLEDKIEKTIKHYKLEDLREEYQNQSLQNPLKGQK